MKVFVVVMMMTMITTMSIVEFGYKFRMLVVMIMEKTKSKEGP
jgi:hypothetical protein